MVVVVVQTPQDGRLTFTVGYKPCKMLNNAQPPPLGEPPTSSPLSWLIPHLSLLPTLPVTDHAHCQLQGLPALPCAVTIHRSTESALNMYTTPVRLASSQCASYIPTHICYGLFEGNQFPHVWMEC
jgi:hypothetical protein